MLSEGRQVFADIYSYSNPPKAQPTLLRKACAANTIRVKDEGLDDSKVSAVKSYPKVHG